MLLHYHPFVHRPITWKNINILQYHSKKHTCWVSCRVFIVLHVNMDWSRNALLWAPFLSIKANTTSGRQDERVDHGNAPSLDFLSLHIRHFPFMTYQTANLVKSCPAILPPPSTTRWQKWHFCGQLMPLSLSISLMACFPFPRLAQLLALSPSPRLVLWGRGRLQLTGQCRLGDN